MLTVKVIKAEDLKVGDCMLCGTHGIPSFNTVSQVVKNEEKKSVYVTIGQVSVSQHYIETYSLRFGQVVLNAVVEQYGPLADKQVQETKQ